LKNKNPSKKGIYYFRKSILMDYFVRKIRFFGQLEQKI